MTLSSYFLALTVFFSAFNPILSSSFTGDDSEKLTIPLSPRQVNFLSISTSKASPTNCPASNSLSPRFSFLSRSRSNSGVGGRERSSSLSATNLRALIAEDKREEIFALHPTEPLASRGRSPLAVFFEGGNFHLAAEMMVANLFSVDTEADEVMASKFIYLAVNSRNAMSIECVSSALKVSEVSIEAALKKAFNSPFLLLKSLLEIEEQQVALDMIQAVIQHWALDLDSDCRSLLRPLSALIQL